MILPNQFYDLLDCLAGQFFTSESARCVAKEFGIQMVADAKDYFSVALIPESLTGDKAVLGLLVDDSAHIGSRNGFTLTIYIDLSKIKGEVFKIFSSIIISHEICHFAFYYELFLKLGGNSGSVVHSNFTHKVSGKLEDSITKEQDNTSQTIFDEHNIKELVETFGKYPKKHFAKGNETRLDYHDLFCCFLEHLRFYDMLAEWKAKNRQS